ncbi:MAG: EVE domain-containing protein [Deltaproteobacteria bacterium]|nr:EVE domain-containing protein [Deltaproteobacteria bacterium]
MPPGARRWLIKSEPAVYSIDDLARDRRTRWEGVRNYQARNHLRAMAEGDLALFYHSNAEPSGVAGVVRIARAAYPDPTALDPKSEYHDPKATAADPRWSLVDVEFVEKLPRVVPLQELKDDPKLDGMEVTRRGSRLSVSEVSAAHFSYVLALSKKKAKKAESPRPA